MTTTEQIPQLVIAPSSEDLASVVGLLAHDLSSPGATIITTLQGIIDIHQDDEALLPVLSLLRGALAAAYRQHNIVNDMLDLPRLALNEPPLQLFSLDLAELLREVLEFEQRVRMSKKVTIVSHVPEDASFKIRGEDPMLRRVLFALFDNTAKFVTNNARIDIYASHTDDTVTLTLKDNGRPIAPEFEEHFLDRLSSLNMRFNKTRTSVGASIPFANAAVQAHGGTMTAKSDPSTGLTTFTLTFPIDKSDESDSSDGGKPTP